MAPASSPEPQTFFQNINEFWGLIGGVFVGLTVSVKIIWNIAQYSRGIDDKFVKLESDIEELHKLLQEVRQELFSHLEPQHQKSALQNGYDSPR
jgi:hypothetical protein